jgi:hypothetical protein
MQPIHSRPFPVIENSENKSIVYTLLPGKPDSRVTRISGPDMRARVLQSAVKDRNVMYYSLNLLRERVGKNPSPEWLEARRVEIICSQHRKKISSQAQISNFTYVMKLATFKNVFHLFTKEAVQDIWTAIEQKKSDFEKKYSIAACQDIRALLPAFLAQDQFANLHDYLQHMMQVTKPQIDEEFLRQMGTSSEEIYNKERVLYEIDEIKGKRWNELDSTYQDHFRLIYVFNTMAKAYQLRQAHWRPWPGTGIHSLIWELADKGPMLVLGQYGSSRYVEDPVKCSKTLHDPVQNCEHSVYAWSQKSLPPIANLCDPFLIIGAKILENGNEVVYFCDCLSDSSPVPGSRKIYAMTFKCFIENIADMRGVAKNYEGFFPFGYHSSQKPY